MKAGVRSYDGFQIEIGRERLQTAAAFPTTPQLGHWFIGPNAALYQNECGDVVAAKFAVMAITFSLPIAPCGTVIFRHQSLVIGPHFEQRHATSPFRRSDK